jgi:hypothetical protein
MQALRSVTAGLSQRPKVLGQQTKTNPTYPVPARNT